MNQKNEFENLNKINVQGHIESKNGLSYLSWTWAWSELKKIYPNATYEIKKFDNNLPYVYDENTGYMVFTTMTINDLTYEMWLPVMDGNNKAMLSEPYKYKVKEYSNGKATGNYIEKEVAAATMFDINKTIMRCLVKNIAMFGLGLYIYAGEDLPEGYEISKEEAEKVVVNFGKYSGKNLKEIKEVNEKYLYWLIENSTSESLKNACSKLVIDTDTDIGKIYEHFNVKNNTELSVDQLKEAIKILKKKVSA